MYCVSMYTLLKAHTMCYCLCDCIHVGSTIYSCHQGLGNKNSTNQTATSSFGLGNSSQGAGSTNPAAELRVLYSIQILIRIVNTVVWTCSVCQCEFQLIYKLRVFSCFFWRGREGGAWSTIKKKMGQTIYGALAYSLISMYTNIKV